MSIKHTVICDTCKEEKDDNCDGTMPLGMIPCTFRDIAIHQCVTCLKKMFAAVGFNFHQTPDKKTSICELPKN